MPPIRSAPKTITPAKTERSHLENVERAYVAASRRSDRSLEARIESARRASEIHKQRTGRSLRITESAVVNEEMYEEDDDDLPSHMRRLTAHLRLSEADADLDRRLGNLLASQIGMRQALAMPPRRSSYASLQHSPNSPYPTPQGGFHQSQSPLFNSGYSHNPNLNSQQYSHLRNSSMSNAPNTKIERTESPTNSPFAFQQFPSHLDEQSPFHLGSPLTSELPIETQQILAGSNFNFNDPTLGMLMHDAAADDTSNPLVDAEPVDDMFQSQGDVDALFNDMVAYGS